MLFRSEDIGGIEIGHALVRLAERRHFEIAVDPEQVAHLHHLVGRFEDRGFPAVGLGVGDIGHVSRILASQERLEARVPHCNGHRAKRIASGLRRKAFPQIGFHGIMTSK